MKRALARRLSAFLWTLRHDLRTALAQYPWPYLTLMKLRPQRRDLVVGRDTDLVIEGFPRSGNTFAVAAMTVAHPEGLQIAHHLHAPAQVLWAARYSIPTLVLARHPMDAVLSLVLREPRLSLRQGLRDYIRFYSRVLPFRKRFVVASFQLVTTDFGRVLHRVNERFSTHFGPFTHDAETTETCFDLIDTWHKQVLKTDTVLDTKVARPTDSKARAKAVLEEELRGPTYRPLLSRAEELYAEIIIQQDGPDH